MIDRRAIGSALAVALLALLLTAASTGAAQPEGPRLAVVKFNWKPQRTTLLTVGPDGSRPVRLAGGQKEGPLETVTQAPLSWRPDGGEVAFSGLTTIVVVRADGNGVRKLNVRNADSPVYAPDGKTLAFTRIEGRGASIWTIELASGAQHRLTPLRHGLEYVASSFSPDGSTLLATIFNRREGKAEPVALQLDSGYETRILAYGREPVYSPDGSTIALSREVGKQENDDLFVLDVATNKLRRLTRTPHKNELFASWDPSGQRIVFTRFRGGHNEWASTIVEINADGTCESEVLSQKRTVFWGAAWQPGPGREAGPMHC
jgi:Tol biopolymer transport system component